ncbi:Fe-S cluster assembly protein SufD [Roseibium limicola]|uniref:Fe-S cluster assembly protein SufD n=1 Tax=Roseibium limicola TaxID=2816037 RepID=A0A939J5W4_9HYPH|nr:Fe-S cluster assembly protein SufD [Roseibium limicola]MBO0346250.1 Fe-S cluster assembly protein SufD [Roseibium limicola]
MTAPTQISHTQAESDLLARFDTAKGDLSGSTAVSDLRVAAAEQIKTKGLPHRRVEEYKYTDLRAYMKSAAPLAPKASAAEAKALADAENAYGELERFRIVVANGTYLAEVSDLEALAAEGVTVTDFAAALDQDTAADLLATPPSAGTDGVLALNTAFVQGGVVITVKEGADVSRPVELVHVSTAEGAIVTRNRINVAKGAKLKMLESFAGTTGTGETNVVFDYKIADNAEFATTRLVVGATEGARLLTTLATIGADAIFKILGFMAGPAFARNQQFVAFEGENSEAKLYGVSMARDRCLADQTLIIDHAVPHCNSREYFKTVLDDEARGVYQGRINVAQHAQKSDGEMMTQALLLSEGPEMANKPELEIFADDVLCAHGATSGQIDEDLLFYLRARGIPEAEARTLLVLAFLSEAIEEFEEEYVTDFLEQRVRDWLAGK